MYGILVLCKLSQDYVYGWKGEYHIYLNEITMLKGSSDKKYLASQKSDIIIQYHAARRITEILN